MIIYKNHIEKIFNRAMINKPVDFFLAKWADHLATDKTIQAKWTSYAPIRIAYTSAVFVCRCWH